MLNSPVIKLRCARRIRRCRPNDDKMSASPPARYTCLAPTGVRRCSRIRLPTDIEERLDPARQGDRRTKTFYAREAILEHLDELEDLYLAEQRLINNRAGRSRTYTLEEVERELGLAD